MKPDALHQSPASATRDTTVGRLSDTFSLSKSVVLPGQSGDGSKSKSSKATYAQSVARIGVQVAEALDYAHDQDILHRDIKPSNLLLDTRGTVWFTDFGLAKTDDHENLTGTGDIVGTLRYMAPEMFDGKADVRSDIYALGLTLYELLALKPAFDESDRHKLIRQVGSQTPERLRKFDAHIPKDLETIVHKAIDRDPSHLYQSAAELAHDLQRFVDDEPIQGRRADENLQLARRAVDEMYEAYRKALETQQSLADQFPEVPDYRVAVASSYYALGTALERHPDRWEASEQAYDQALAQQEKLVADFPAASGHRSQLEIWYSKLGMSWAAMGRLAKAEQALRRRLAIVEKTAAEKDTAENPSEKPSREMHVLAWGRFDLALVLHQRGQAKEAADLFHQALDHFKKAAAESPDDPKMLNWLAWCLATCPATEFHDPPRAVELAKKTVQTTPESADYWEMLGLAQYRAGEWTAAIEALRRSMELSVGVTAQKGVHGRACVRLFLAMTHWQLGHHDQARNWYDEALQHLEKNDADYSYDEWTRFRVEADELMGVANPESAPRQSAWEAVVSAPVSASN